MSQDVIRSGIVAALGLIMITVGYVVFPVVIEGAEEVRLATNLSQYTGIDSINGIGPMVIYVVWLFLGALTSFMGAKGVYKGIKG